MLKKLTYLIILHAGVYAMNWNEILEKNNELLIDKGVVLRQYEAFDKSEAPTIVDSRIKEIFIPENYEEFIDLKLIASDRISMMAQPSNPFEGPTFNSGFPDSSKMRASVFFRLQEMVEHLDEIARDFEYEPGQINILVFEGLRSLKVQQMLFDNKLKETLLLNPDLNLEMAEKETSKWVSSTKNNIPVHSTGAAVDIRLWDNNNECFLDLGPFGVIWGDNQLAPTFTENISDIQKKNRLFCLIVAERSGLTNYVYEWWHFSFGDRYDVYWKEQSIQEELSERYE